MWGLMLSSTYNLIAISFERYLAVVHPIWHKVYFTNSKANIIAICIWFFGVSFTASLMIPTTGAVHGVCIMSGFWPSSQIAQAVGCVKIFVNFVVPIFVHSFCYARILSALRKRTARVNPKYELKSATQTGTIHTTSGAQTTKAGAIHMIGIEPDSTRTAVSLPSTSGTNVLANPTPSDSIELAPCSSNKQPNSFETRNNKAQRNVIKTLAIVTACYFICWMPNKIHIVLLLMGAILPTFGELYKVTVILAFVNCCINPMIYIGKYDAFKTGLSMLLENMKLRRCSYCTRMLGK